MSRMCCRGGDQCHPPSDSFYKCTDFFRLTSIAFNDADVCASVHKCAGASAGQRGWLPLEQEVVAKCPTWVLGTELRSLH